MSRAWTTRQERVASHTEAWIETGNQLYPMFIGSVASHTEAWIETFQAAL